MYCGLQVGRIAERRGSRNTVSSSRNSADQANIHADNGAYVTDIINCFVTHYFREITHNRLKRWKWALCYVAWAGCRNTVYIYLLLKSVIEYSLV